MMALYLDAAAILSSPLSSKGSFRSRVYNSNLPFKTSPALLYALISECAKWDVVLSEVIDNAGIIIQEPKLNPVLALLLTHDHLLSKRGIACPQNHPLRLAIERHKARLSSELTKARLRRSCPTLEALRLCVLEEETNTTGCRSQLRWIRINGLKTCLDQELTTTFSKFTERTALTQLITEDQARPSYFRDPNVHELVATNASSKIIADCQSYKSGNIILQDKASCFPAHLLLDSTPQIYLPQEGIIEGDVLDACAAPGNKTSHLASILATRANISGRTAKCERAIFGCERDAKRSKTLEIMLDRAGAGNIVKVLAGQDFLALTPKDQRLNNVTHLLLDPSCSGSGILGRQDVPSLTLPKDPRTDKAGVLRTSDCKAIGRGVKNEKKKRKRTSAPQIMTICKTTETNGEISSLSAIENDRLRRLSNVQTRIIEHAFAFPNARIATYSTCSIHATENEVVALRALSSEVAKRRGWRVLRRDEQPNGLKSWPHRGNFLGRDERTEIVEESWDLLTKEAREEFKEACIKCNRGGEDGTMGFFVVGFVRDPQTLGDAHVVLDAGNNAKDFDGDEDDWEGFSSAYADD